jgi:hypothetical protein
MLAVCAVAAAAVLGAALSLAHAQATQEGHLSLLQTLSAWKYPESTMHGASMSDGGNARMQSVKCQSVLTTPDAIEKVIEYYEKKFGISPTTGQQERRADVAEGDAQSVSSQDDSQGRPVRLRIIVVNKADTSTTLAISRAEGEKETHIAWSHYIRLGDKR